MQIEIKTQPLLKTLFGTSTTHDASQTYADEIINLLDYVWLAIKEQHLKHQGTNYALYSNKGNELFVGVEVTSPFRPSKDFEVKKIDLKKYAYGKHIGPYQHLPSTHAEIKKSLQAMGTLHGEPIIEIYGHWTEDASKLETEILYPIG